MSTEHDTTNDGVPLARDLDVSTETPNEWTNYGDVDPKLHGGNWVRWDGDAWNVVVTTPRDVLGEGEIQVESYHFHPTEVWVDGDPFNGFTDAFDTSRCGRATDPDHVRDMGFVASELAVGFPHRYRGRTTVIDADNYWNHLEDNHGITDS